MADTPADPARSADPPPAGSDAATPLGSLADHAPTRDRPHVVIIGSGFGGLFAAKELRKAPVDITLISSSSHHLFQPLLYQVATGILSSGEIAPATREVLSKQDNTTVLAGNVVDIDLRNKVVTSDTAAQLQYRTEYDSLIVAAGAGQSYFGNDQFAEFAPGMKTVDDARELRARIFGAFEMAEVEPDPAKITEWLTFVVVGAGPTGVEMAGQIAEMSRITLKRDFRRIDPTNARVVLIDAAPQVLPPFGEKLGLATQRQLEKLGIEVQLSSRVVDIDATGLEYEDDSGRHRIPSRCVVWAAGVAASPLGKHLADQCGAEVDRAGRIAVEPDLTLPGHPEVFVVGDMISLDRLPGVAQVAMQGGTHAARTVKARLQGDREPGAFRYKDKGSMATISRFQAVVKTTRVELVGFIAWLMWLVVHLFYLVGFKNRFTTLVNWFVTFVTNDRSQRAVTVQQAVARTAIERVAAVDPEAVGQMAEEDAAPDPGPPAAGGGQ